MSTVKSRQRYKKKLDGYTNERATFFTFVNWLVYAKRNNWLKIDEIACNMCVIRYFFGFRNQFYAFTMFFYSTHFYAFHWTYTAKYETNNGGPLSVNWFIQKSIKLMSQNRRLLDLIEIDSNSVDSPHSIEMWSLIMHQIRLLWLFAVLTFRINSMSFFTTIVPNDEWFNILLF